MSRLAIPSSRDDAPAPSRPMLDAVKAQLGAMPNFVRALAIAPAALKGFVGLYAIAGEGALDAATRERIALAVAEANACQYCVSAHSALAPGAGLDPTEAAEARRGGSSNSKAAAAVAFALALTRSAGEVSTAEFDAAKSQLSDEEMIEVIAHVALNVFTNMLGKALRVPIDFPEVELLRAA